jgi:putative glutamine amidotransferase
LPLRYASDKLERMSNEKQQRPRVGIPYRTRKEELNGSRGKFEKYARAVEMAGGMPVEISLGLRGDELRSLAQSLDAIVLPGSPADVNPALYRAARHEKSADADGDRERTDYALVEHALDEGKPVLAICYGVQILNVVLGGTLIQDIRSEIQTTIQHERDSERNGSAEPLHAAKFEKDSRLAKMAGAIEARVNSSHHQAIREPGCNLRVVGTAPDGVIEAVEWIGDAKWVMGVQWHPERMVDDKLARSLFRELVAAARGAVVRA